MSPHRLWVAVLLSLAAIARAQGQTAPVPPNQNRTVNLNYVYAASLGFGGYSLAGLTADVYTLPLEYAFHDTPRDGWTLRLMAPVQGGLYSFHANDTNGQRISLDQQSLSVVPGAELQIPLGDRAVLKPFAQFGIAHAFGTGGQNPDAWVYLAGARSVVRWQAEGYTFLLGNAAVFAGDTTIGSGFRENYVSLQIGGEVRHALGFTLGSFTPDLGLYLADYYYPSPLTFSRFLRSPLRVSNQNEIGLSIGSATPFKMLFVSNPRIGASFVFGGGLNVWHITFGFPF